MAMKTPWIRDAHHAVHRVIGLDCAIGKKHTFVRRREPQLREHHRDD
jgi:hypothetical protein